MVKMLFKGIDFVNMAGFRASAVPAVVIMHPPGPSFLIFRGPRCFLPAPLLTYNWK